MSFADLIQGAELRGDAIHLDVVAATRLGRAFGTVLRRRGSGTDVVVLGRCDDAMLPVRDGLVRGLILTGHDVRDLGMVDAALVAVAVDRFEAVGAALLHTIDDSTRVVRFSLGRRPLGDDALAELSSLADGDDFSAGTGSLTMVDPRTDLRSEVRSDLRNATRDAGARG